MKSLVQKGTVNAFRQGTLATAVVTLELLAYLPFVARAAPRTESASPSRVAELMFLGAAILIAMQLRVPTWARPSWITRSLGGIVLVFAVWAMLTSLLGPMALTGVVKAVELAALCVCAYQVSGVAAVWRGHWTVASIGALAVVTVMIILLIANIPEHGTLLPMPSPDNWYGEDLRPRLVLGSNHPLVSALVLAIGIILTCNASFRWWIKFPIIAGLAILLFLCDARGISAGCVIGLLLMWTVRIPSSPTKLLMISLASGAFLMALMAILMTADVRTLLQHVIGEDTFTLNSRIGLWEYILNDVPQNILVGVGYYSTRMYILAAFPFAGNAHNSFIEVLYSTGIVGLMMLMAFYVAWLYVIYVTRDLLLIGITPIAFFEGMLDPIVFTPDVGMTLILLVLFGACRRADTADMAAFSRLHFRQARKAAFVP